LKESGLCLYKINNLKKAKWLSLGQNTLHTLHKGMIF